MKRIILFFVCISLLASGCVKDQYAVERDYWRLSKQVQAIFRNPVATPTNELNRVVALLNKFAVANSGNMLAAQAEFSIGRLYLVKSLYGYARSQFAQIAKKYHKSVLIVSECVFLTGRSYQLEGNKDAAISEFSKLMRESPLTPRGMQMPVYIAQYYQSRHEPEKAQEAFGQAVAHYQRLAEKNPSSKAALQSYSAIANCYSAMRDWNGVVQTLETVAEKFKGKVPLDGVYFNLAVIYKEKLHDAVKARLTFERLLNEYPKSRFTKVAKKLIATENGRFTDDRGR